MDLAMDEWWPAEACCVVMAGTLANAVGYVNRKNMKSFCLPIGGWWRYRSGHDDEKRRGWDFSRWSFRHPQIKHGNTVRRVFFTIVVLDCESQDWREFQEERVTIQ